MAQAEPQRLLPGIGAVALASLLCVLACAARPASALDLARAYESARTSDPTLAAAEAAYRAGLEVLPQARSALGPSVQASGTLNRLASRASTAESGEVGLSTSASIGAVQPLYRAAARYGVNQAELKMPGLDAQLAQARQDLILRVARAYFSVLQAAESLEATRVQKDAIGALHRQAVRAYEIGTGNLIEEAEASSRFDLISATELQARGVLQNARRTLEQVIGEPVDALGRLSLADVAALSRRDEADWLRQAAGTSPEIVQAQSQLDAQRVEIDIARAAWLPTLDLMVSATRTYSSQTNLTLNRTDGRSAAVGLSLSVPLWEAGLRDSKLRQAQAQVDQYDRQLAGVRRGVDLSVRQALTSFDTGLVQVRALEQAVKSSELSLQASVRGREIGSRTVLDVLNARQQLFVARSLLTGARYGAVLALLELKAAAGVLSADDLRSLTDRTDEMVVTGLPAGE